MREAAGSRTGIDHRTHLPAALLGQGWKVVRGRQRQRENDTTKGADLLADDRHRAMPTQVSSEGT